MVRHTLLPLLDARADPGTKSDDYCRRLRSPSWETKRVEHKDIVSSPNLPWRFLPSLFSFSVFVYLCERLRERERTRRGWAERWGEGASEAGSALTAESPTRGSSSRTTRYDLNRSQRLN